MAGTGTHLHQVVKECTGEDYTDGCSCKSLVAKMNKNPPSWSYENRHEIRAVMWKEAMKRHWWARIISKLPGVQRPILWMIAEARRRAEKDLV